MTSAKRGIFVMLSNKNFAPESRFQPRRGSHLDREELTQVFSQLGFEILVYNDVTASQAYHYLDKGASAACVANFSKNLETRMRQKAQSRSVGKKSRRTKVGEVFLWGSEQFVFSPTTVNVISISPAYLPTYYSNEHICKSPYGCNFRGTVSVRSLVYSWFPLSCA